MASQSLKTWRTVRKKALDELVSAHLSLQGSGRGKRYATQQINQAYTVLLCSHFQAFCRDLHSECADCMILTIPNLRFQTLVRDVFVMNRKLDHGNPNPGNIGSDYNRFGLIFWDEVKADRTENQSCITMLGELNKRRNAIAHQDFESTQVGPQPLRLGMIRAWRKACQSLAISFDTIMYRYLNEILGKIPW